MNVQLQTRFDENQKLEKRMENLKKEMHEKSSSYEALMTEKNQLEVVLKHKQIGDGVEGKCKILQT